MAIIKIFVSAVICFVCFIQNTTSIAETGVTGDNLYEGLELKPFSYHEGFENRDPFTNWTSDGTYTVNYKGLTSKKVIEGNKAFKVDLYFGTATYVYFQIPIKIPSNGKLSFEGEIFIEDANQAHASLGTNFIVDPPHIGGVNVLERQGVGKGYWQTQTSDLVAAGNEKANGLLSKYCAKAELKDTGVYCNKIGLFVFGKTNSSIVIYVDNLRIVGTAPKLDAYQLFSKMHWHRYQEKLSSELDKLAINKKDGFDSRLQAKIDTLYQTFKVKGYFSIEEYETLNTIKELLKYKEFNRGTRNRDLVIFPWNPTSNIIVEPNAHTIPARPGNAIFKKGCAGEYLSASFIVNALKDIDGISISAGDLIGSFKTNTIAKEHINIRIVKHWYQAGRDSLYNKADKKVLVPELLLKDDSLVERDDRKQENFLKISKNGLKKYINISKRNSKIPQGVAIVDSIFLQPFQVKAGENKQLWLTIHIPENTPPDEYKSTIVLNSLDGYSEKIFLNVKVLRFQLPKPVIEYSIYYRGKLSSSNQNTIGSEYKSMGQYITELKNMKEHGITSPTLYQHYDKMLDECLKVRSNIGISNENMYVVGFQTKRRSDSDYLIKLEEGVRKWLSVGAKHGYQNIYFYGVDEAGRDGIRQQKKAWEVIHKIGAKVFAACPHDAIKVSDGLLDIGVLNGRLNSKIADIWHRSKKKIFSYSNPQIGVENPNIYRKNYGFDLWVSKYNGAMNYAYQHAMGNIWNDFDHQKYRDHVFAYPTTNGVIDTIQWEGFREAINDVRYLTLYLQFSRENEEETRKWLGKMIDDKTPNEMRDELIERILSLDE